jgi:hypothetical protein
VTKATKNKTRKLSINRETLRILSNLDLALAIGGVDSAPGGNNQCPVISDSCRLSGLMPPGQDEKSC